MFIIHELIRFLFYNLILVNVVNNLKTSDDLFSNFDYNLLPEQFQQNSTADLPDATLSPEIVKNLTDAVTAWFDQINVLQPKENVSVSKVSVPETINFIGFFFIVERPDNISIESNFFDKHIININSYLRKLRILSFIAGIAYVPLLPFKVIQSVFLPAVQDKLSNILKANQHSDAVISVFVLFRYKETLYEVYNFLCSSFEPIIIFWHYNQTQANFTSDDALLLTFLPFIGSCYFEPCHDLGGNFACDIDFQNTSYKYHTYNTTQCMERNIRLHNPDCSNKAPEKVFRAICGNGIVEGNETCDCLNFEECDPHCNQKICELINDYTSVIVILLIIGILGSLYVLLYFRRKKESTHESQVSDTAIHPGKYESRVHSKFDFQSKIKSKLETVGMKQAKEKLEIKFQSNELSPMKASHSETLGVEKSFKTQIIPTSSKTIQTKILDMKKSSEMNNQAQPKSNVSSLK